VNTTDAYRDVVRFHGHECPGAGVGTRIAEVAVARLGRHGPDNNLVAVSETDACALDAVQVLTGCTFGKRNMVHRDHGKNAFVFWRRSDGTGVRITVRPGSAAFRDDRTWALARKLDAGTATEAEAAQFAETQSTRLSRILTAPAEELLVVEELTGEAPAVKPLGPTEACEQCREQTSVNTLHNHRGRMICPPCHLAAHGGVLPPDHGHGHQHGDHAHPRAHSHTDGNHAHVAAHSHDYP
jgi:formylmethanofuran dehydrogenase subunit E